MRSLLLPLPWALILAACSGPAEPAANTVDVAAAAAQAQSDIANYAAGAGRAQRVPRPALTPAAIATDLP